MKRFIQPSLISAILIVSGLLLSACNALSETRIITPSSTAFRISPSPRPSATPPPPTPTLAPISTLPVSLLPLPVQDVTLESPLSPNTPKTTPFASVPIYTYKILNTYPHDANAFTQGLLFEDGRLYEGTGLRGRSSLRLVELKTGVVVQSVEIPDQYFAEGVTILEDKIYQLTWQSNVGFVYDKNSFEMLREFAYPTEGWGLTHDGDKLIMSDGTATLYFLDPVTLAGIGQLEVKIASDPLTRLAPPGPCFPWGRRTEVHVYGEPAIGLNELEYIQGEIFANVWQSNCIARIDAQTGQLTGWIELGGLLGSEDYDQPVDVLNGIAYDAANDRLFVTGKLWPKLFEIELLEKKK